jgi:pyruvate,water dikinase
MNMEASLRNAPNILTLKEITKDDIPLVGGKGASLGEMTTIGLPVPAAFVVTAQAYRKFLIESRIEDDLFGTLRDIDVEDTAILEQASARSKAIIMDAPMPEYLKNEIRSAYQAMGKNVIVAVRSSATAEDLPGASFAGQQETFLNVLGISDLLEAVQKCWASLFTPRAIYYRSRQGFEDSQVNIAVVVQQMIPSEKAGVMFTSHPVSGEPETIVEGSWGLGEAIVSGSVSPDKYVYDRRKGKVVDQVIATKKVAIVPLGKKGTKEIELPLDKQNSPVLSDDEVRKLAEFGAIAEEHYGIPQDVEWAIVKDELYILQSRPITTIKSRALPEKGKAGMMEEGEGRILIQGQGASPGVAGGRVTLVSSMKDVGKVQSGDIMVTKMTNPDMVPAMRKVAGIVTDEGGMTCHAAIVSRELGTPAVVGTKKATSVLKEGQMVTIDGEKGLVYEGGAAKMEQRAMPVAAGGMSSSDRVITATLVKVNVSLPEAAQRAAATGADGVGLLRIEHLILGLNKTPGWYIQNKKEEEFIQELHRGIKIVLDAFPGKPVWVRTLDAPTDEFRNMLGGEDEPEEHNPMLGWRGIRRDLASPEQFRLQVMAFKRLWDEGYHNLGLMFPMVNHPDEFTRAKQLIQGWGINAEAVTLGIMIEIPSSALLVEEFIKRGIRFASFGTNDLIQYTLAIDRNNQLVADMYYPKHPAVLRLIDDAIQACRKYHVECSICGQAGSDPEMAEWLVEHGISSVSANIDAVAKIRESVARTEQRMILEMARKINA